MGPGKGRAGARASGTALVVDGESPLGQGLVRLLGESGYRVAATCRSAEGATAGILAIPWGRASTVSARNVLLQALAAFERLDLALFTFEPSLDRVLLHEASYADLESAVDRWVRGTLFLLRELIGQLVRQGSGTLALVQGFARGGAAESPPLEALVRGAVGELGSSLLASYGGTGVTVLSFETTSPEVDGYLRFVSRRLRSTRARSFRYRPVPFLSR